MTASTTSTGDSDGYIEIVERLSDTSGQFSGGFSYSKTCAFWRLPGLYHIPLEGRTYV